MKLLLCSITVVLMICGGVAAETLHDYAAYGDIVKIDRLLKSGANVNARDKEGRTPLHLAARGGRLHAAMLLVRKGAEVDPKDAKGETPLMYAATMGCPDILSLLLEQGADPKARNSMGITTLVCALGPTPKNAECTYRLLMEGVDANMDDGTGTKPLHRAVYGKSKETARVLLAYGADPSLKDNQGRTALALARELGHTEMVALFSDEDSIANARFHVCAERGDVAEMAKLLKRGVNVNAPGRYNMNALHVAAAMGHADIVELLLQHGAAVNALGEDGYTPLHFAATRDNADVAKILISNGADLNAQTAIGSPVHYAAIFSAQNVLQQLLDKGADVNARSKGKATPLMYAAADGRSEIGRMLLASGADASLKNKNGATALDIALAGGHTQMANVLSAASAASTSGGDTSGGEGEWTFHNGSFVESTAGGTMQKDPANKELDDMVSTALKIQGIANTINRVRASSGGGRKFVGKGSPPLNSFSRNNKANKRYYKWAFGL